MDMNPYKIPDDEEIAEMRRLGIKIEKKHTKADALKDTLQSIKHKRSLSSGGIQVLGEQRIQPTSISPTSRIQPTSISPTRSTSISPTRHQTQISTEKGRSGLSSSPNYTRNRETVREFVAKKKETFLVQLALDVRVEEIKNLEEKSIEQENALALAEKALQEDAAKFDAFLVSNDALAHETMKKAENLIKLKQQKQAIVRDLKNEISSYQSDISRYCENKYECEKFKSFVEILTPNEWIIQQNHIKKKRKEERKNKYIETEKRQLQIAMEGEINEIENKYKNDIQKLASIDSKKKTEEKKKNLKAAKDTAIGNVQGRYEQVDKIDYQDESSGEDLPMYFKEPQQLLDIFSTLEMQNLGLIQNIQELEASIEEAACSKQTIHNGQSGSKIDWLTQEIETQEANISQMEKLLKGKDSHGSAGKLLHKINRKIIEVYNKCGGVDGQMGRRIWR
eukprot:GHVL01015150.1.p1 GENE.GHVL01015150.1~~GHVL01015150.1.p1  ORF type:complete len:451 (-),score=128.99 GHVL01015150.1:35-1387(-)